MSLEGLVYKKYGRIVEKNEPCFQNLVLKKTCIRYIIDFSRRQLPQLDKKNYSKSNVEKWSKES